MFVQFVGLREIPTRTLRLVVTAAAQYSCPCVVVRIFVRPLPDVACEVFHPERAGAARMSGNIIGAAKNTPLFRKGYGGCVPLLSPGIKASVISLGRILPLPFVREPLARPAGIGARIFERYPGNRIVRPAVRKATILPILQEAVILPWWG